MGAEKVVSLGVVKAPEIPPVPKHFKAAQKAAWSDLVDAAPVESAKRENRFTLEVAATLMAKFRSGKAMTATETKEMKRSLVVLGLAQADDDGGKKKPKKNARYFGDSE